MREKHLVAILATVVATAILGLVAVSWLRTRPEPVVVDSSGSAPAPVFGRWEPPSDAAPSPPRAIPAPESKQTPASRQVHDALASHAAALPESSKERLDIPMQVRGLVLDHLGKPIDGARVRLLLRSRDRGHRIIPRPTKTRDGRFFTSIHVRVGDAFFGEVEARHDDYLAPARGAVTIVVDSVADTGVLQFQKTGGRIVGRVVRDGKHGVPGMALELVPQQAAPDTPGPVLCITDEEGTFRSPLVDTGGYSIRATPLLSGVGRPFVLREPGDVVDLGNLELGEGAVFSTMGFVRDRKGRTPAEVFVALVETGTSHRDGKPTPAESILTSVRAAVDGRFRLELDRPGPLQLVVSPDPEFREWDTIITDFWLLDQQLLIDPNTVRRRYDPCLHSVEW